LSLIWSDFRHGRDAILLEQRAPASSWFAAVKGARWVRRSLLVRSPLTPTTKTTRILCVATSLYMGIVAMRTKDALSTMTRTRLLHRKQTCKLMTQDRSDAVHISLPSNPLPLEYLSPLPFSIQPLLETWEPKSSSGKRPPFNAGSHAMGVSWTMSPGRRSRSNKLLQTLTASW
jgi:hypothetical protein